MPKQEGFDKYKVPLAFVGGSLLIAIVIIMFIHLGPGQEKFVVFSGYGVPHCPTCFQMVRPYSDFCPSCKQTFRWTNTFTKCPYCKGSGKCPECFGIGVTENYTQGSRQKGSWTQKKEGGLIYTEVSQSASPIKDKIPELSTCWYCSGGFQCPMCNGEGWRRFGNGPVEYEDMRK